MFFIVKFDCRIYFFTVVYTGCRMVFYEEIREHLLQREANGQYAPWFDGFSRAWK